MLLSADLPFSCHFHFALFATLSVSQSFSFSTFSSFLTPYAVQKLLATVFHAGACYLVKAKL